MRFEKGHKDATRQRIISIAAEKFRKDGIAAVGIAGVMAEAGLTHGGFYAHFESKEDLVRQAMEVALDSTKDRIGRAAEKNDAGLEGVLRTYLRAAHRDAPEKGCAVAALAAEIARHPDETRGVFTTRLERMVERIAAQMPASEEKRATAIGITALMVGSLQLARVANDPKLSDEILESAIQSGLRLAKTADPAK